MLPGDVQILERMALAQRRLGMWEESVAGFMQALELDPGNSRSATLAIETLDAMRDWDRILSLTESWTAQFPDARDIQIVRAMTFANQSGDLGKARILFDQVPPSNSDDYLNNLVYLSLLERNYEAVIKALNMPELVTLSTNGGWLGWREWTLGVVLNIQGRTEEAEAAFRQGLALFDDWEPTGVQNTDGWDLIYLALLHAELGNEQEAIKMAARSVDIVPEAKDAMNGGYIAGFNAQVLGLTGHRDEALAEIARLLDTPAGLIHWQVYFDPTWDFFRDDERFNELIRPKNFDEVTP